MLRQPCYFKIQIKTPQCIIPSKAHPSDAGWDLYLPKTASVAIPPLTQTTIDLGFSAELPRGTFALLKIRSSLAAQGLSLNAGVIDADYRGSWKVLLRNDTNEMFHLQGGDRVAQAIILPLAPVTTIVVASELGESERGEGGFGSTGRNIEEVGVG